jgi:hypothetical protein
LALAGFNDIDIELHTNGKYDIEHEAEDYVMYFRYFFSVAEWTLKKRRSYVFSRKWETQKETRLFKDALLGDKPRLLWQLGFAPGIAMDEMLQDMINDSYFHFKKHVEDDEKEEAHKWASTLKTLATHLDKVSDDKAEQEDMYEEMLFKVQGTDIDIDIINIEDTDAEVPEGDSMSLEEVEPDIIDIEDLDSLG